MYSGSSKEKALNLRRQGVSIRKISDRLNIPKSTLSGWFKNIQLTQKQKEKLKGEWQKGLVKAREKAKEWHIAEKEKRISIAKDKAKETLTKIHLGDKSVLKLALALLYLGEGFKTGDTGMGNSNPIILKFFIESIIKLYDLDYTDFYCDLHLRSDQDEKELTEYWSKSLKIPKDNFKHTFFDKRTLGKRTYSHYKGVCLVRIGRVQISRELMFLSAYFCDKVSEQNE
ncbi:helix-turn-helix domain-containing protein [Candidatus Nomurabacteria bacterium]|nr:helix-turn-helix domain-containing protein [Candidatus Nomurabacteria bacterium]